MARAALAGIAIGGFAATVVTANFIALHALVELNCLAIETACVMTNAVFTKMVKEWQQHACDCDCDCDGDCKDGLECDCCTGEKQN